MYKGEVKSKGSAPVVPRQRKECEIKSLRDGERYQKDKRGRYEIIFKRKHYSFRFDKPVISVVFFCLFFFPDIEATQDLLLKLCCLYGETSCKTN